MAEQQSKVCNTKCLTCKLKSMQYNFLFKRKRLVYKTINTAARKYATKTLNIVAFCSRGAADLYPVLMLYLSKSPRPFNELWCGLYAHAIYLKFAAFLAHLSN